MKEMLEKLRALKKDHEPMDPMHKEAKMQVIKHLHDFLADQMKDKLHGLKKVTVASDSKEGLASGLDKAQEMLVGHAPVEHDLAEPKDEEAEQLEQPEHDLKDYDGEDSEHEAEESPEEEAHESPAEELAEPHVKADFDHEDKQKAKKKKY
jgi:hypothetical protein